MLVEIVAERLNTAARQGWEKLTDSVRGIPHPTFCSLESTSQKCSIILQPGRDFRDSAVRSGPRTCSSFADCIPCNHVLALSMPVR